MNPHAQNQEDLGLSFQQIDASDHEPEVKIALERMNDTQDVKNEDNVPTLTKNIHDAPWGGYKQVDLAEQRVPVQSAAIPANLSEDESIQSSDEDFEPEVIPTSSTIYSRTAQHKFENDALLDCDSVGHMLYTARELLGLTYAEVEIGTKIRGCFVEALEKNELNKLPAKVYIIAYIRSLCTLYRIDKKGQDLIIERLKLLDGYDDVHDGLVDSGIEKKGVTGKPQLIKSSERERKNNIKGLIIVFALTLFICGGLLGVIYFVFYFIDADKPTQSLVNQSIRNERSVFSDSEFSTMYITTPMIKMNEISQE